MISTIAVGTDGSTTAGKAVDVAAEMAQRFDARLVLMSAYGESKAPRGDVDPELQWATNPAARMHEILERTASELGGRGIDCTTRAEEGDPAKTLIELARDCDADLLVIGNKGMDRRVLGSVPNTVAHRAPCSVLVVKTT
jgi:nucleotide-binding universal stress UspA family protein